MERDGGDHASVIHELVHHTFCSQIPQSNTAVISTWCHHSSINWELRGSYPVRVAFECLAELAFMHIPDFDQLVIWGRDKQGAVLVELDWLDWSRVPIHNGASCTCIIVPDTHSCVPRNWCDQAALRVNCDITDGTLMTDEFVWTGICW